MTPRVVSRTTDCAAAADICIAATAKWTIWRRTIITWTVDADDFAFFVGFATAEALVAPQQLEPLVFVSFRLWLVRLRIKLPEPSRQLTVNRRDS